MRQVGEPTGSCLHTVFRERAREAPERIALSWASGSLTYGELDARSDRLARVLAQRGVGPDVLVALCARRGPEAVVGMLAILKAGGAYLPIDPAYPGERIGWLLADSAAPVVVAARDVAAVIDGRHPTVVWTDDEPDATTAPPADRASGENLAYVIYTSGSTGTPKGVTVEHRNVVRLFEQTAAWFGFDHSDTWALFHSLSFDFSVWEVWGALLHGGRLVLLPESATRFPSVLLTALRNERVTVLDQTPSAFHQLWAALAAAPEVDLPDLRWVVFGGERLDPRVLAPWIDRFGDRRPALVNMYGITETTVHCTYRPITAADLGSDGTSPIGVPIPDVALHLLDDAGHPVPDGEPGEIHVAGAGVARGYLNRPELTADRFATVDTAQGPQRRYRSGDRAVRTSDGELVYLGRTDDQLKVRGFRIEPGEVEHRLAEVPGVATVVVAPRDFGGGDVRLVAYLLPVPDAAPAELTTAVERHATATLPRHLRPSHYTVVSEIPMTLQGKVDRHALGK